MVATTEKMTATMALRVDKAHRGFVERLSLNCSAFADCVCIKRRRPESTDHAASAALPDLTHLRQRRYSQPKHALALASVQHFGLHDRKLFDSRRCRFQ